MTEVLKLGSQKHFPHTYITYSHYMFLKDLLHPFHNIRCYYDQYRCRYICKKNVIMTNTYSYI
jgi:hypothetical protein